MRLAILTPRAGRESKADWAGPLQGLISALEAEGAQIFARPWTDDEALTDVEAATPLLAWSYHLEAELWRQSLDRWQASGVRFANPTPVLRWNTDKHYLLELADKGAPVVPTLAVEAVTAETLAAAHHQFGSEIVAKPRISAGAHQTARILDGHALAALPQGPALIQPFLPAVAEEGELSLIYFGGRFSHAVTKVAKPGDFRVQPQYGSTLTRVEPSHEALSVAEAVLSVAPGPTAYARVDLIRVGDGLALMELELIEPDLYLRHAPDRANAFARAMLAGLR